MGFCASAPPLPSVLLYSVGHEKPKMPPEAGQTHESIHLNTIVAACSAEMERTKKVMWSVHSPNPSWTPRRIQRWHHITCQVEQKAWLLLFLLPQLIKWKTLNDFEHEIQSQWFALLFTLRPPVSASAPYGVFSLHVPAFVWHYLL